MRIERYWNAHNCNKNQETLYQLKALHLKLSFRVLFHSKIYVKEEVFLYLIFGVMVYVDIVNNL